MGHRAQERAYRSWEPEGSHPPPQHRFYSGAAMIERYKGGFDNFLMPGPAREKRPEMPRKPPIRRRQYTAILSPRRRVQKRGRGPFEGLPRRGGDRRAQDLRYAVEHLGRGRQGRG